MSLGGSSGIFDDPKNSTAMKPHFPSSLLWYNHIVFRFQKTLEMSYVKRNSCAKSSEVYNFYMTTIVKAIYENQALRLDTPLPLLEGARIEVTVNLPESIPPKRNRFSWENGPILQGDGTSRLSEELRRQRDGEQ